MTNKKILVVEDDSIIGWHIERSLTDLGYRVVGVFDNGETVVETVTLDPPDMVLMDIGLKGHLDGIQTAGILHHKLDVPVVYLTAYTDPVTLERAKQTEPYGYLRKPFDDQALRATIEMALHNHQLKRQLVESEKRYRMLFSTMQEAFALHEIILNDDGKPVNYRFLDVNPAFEQLTGLRSAEVMGKTLKDVLPLTDLDWIETYGQVALTGTPVSLENYSAALDKYFHVTAFSPREGQFATLFYDVTVTKQLEITLRDNEERLRALTAAASCTILEVDTGGRISFANKPLPGYSLQGMLGRELSEWYPPEQREKMDELLEKVFESKQEETILMTFPAEMNAAPTYLLQLTPASSEAGVEIAVLTVTDITEQEQVKQALALERATLSRRVEESTADLRVANAQLARAAQIKDEFLANMSHELRTPMTGILGLTEALRKNIYGPVNPRQENALRNVEESGLHLLSLINDILDLSKIEAGRLELEFRPASLDSVCESSLRLVRETAMKKEIELTPWIDPDLKFLMLDERRLKQILVNLLSNAIKFSPQKGKVDLSFRLDRDRQAVEVSVTDAGIGIQPEDLRRLFQPFVQLDSKLSRAYQGSGLGLSLVLKLAELHGGGIFVESEPEHGSRFSVWLPYKPVRMDQYEEWYRSAGASSYSKRLKHKALVVENSAQDAQDLSRLGDYLLECDVWTPEEDPHELAVNLSPELIFLNPELPGRSGWEVLDRLKGDERTRNIPVVIVSGQDEGLRGTLQGTAAFLVKPVNEQQIWEIVRRILRGREKIGQVTLAVNADLNDVAVMVVEDNDLNLNILTDYLVNQGCQVIAAHNGIEAVELVHERCPDIVLMDIQMPVMDGLEAIRKIRVEQKCLNLPIIALTALAMTGDRERCLQAGANDYLSKPVNFELLCELIARMVGRT